jgi:transposase
VRSALYVPARVALRFNPLIVPLGQRLLAKGMAKKAVQVAGMHKRLHLVYGVLKSGKPFDPNHTKGQQKQD